MALGFRVDFSEDSEPIEELGDRLGPENVATPARRSEPDDVQLSNLPREFKDPGSLVNSPSDPVFPSVFDKIWVDGALEVALVEDNATLSEPSFFKLSTDCKSAIRIVKIKENTIPQSNN